MMHYLWDPAKNASNVRVHGIAFEEAVRIFDGSVLGWPDERFDYGEDRWVAIGVAGEKEVVVVYVEQDNQRRIISARQTTRREHELYWRTVEK